MQQMDMLLLDYINDGVALLERCERDYGLVFINQPAKRLLLSAGANLQPAQTDLSIFGASLKAQLEAILAQPNLQAQSLKAPSPIVAGAILNIQIKPLNVQQVLLIIEDYTRTEHLEQVRTDFVGNVSHELRTPLTVILGYLENFLTADRQLPSVFERGLKNMHEQAQRMNALINDLLMLSRLESDESKPHAVVDMPKLLMKVFDHAQANNQAGHLIDIHLDTDKNIIGIESYLFSAISNLVFNAIKYTPEGGEIDIIWESVADEAHLSVIDNGIGISAEHLPRLTERFYRVDSGRSRATGGTGLGLAIVKHVLNKHRANLQISSTEKQGSTFRLVFPAAVLVGADKRKPVDVNQTMRTL